jgi:hypothetical protein
MIVPRPLAALKVAKTPSAGSHTFINYIPGVVPRRKAANPANHIPGRMERNRESQGSLPWLPNLTTG